MVIPGRNNRQQVYSLSTAKESNDADLFGHCVAGIHRDGMHRGHRVCGNVGAACLRSVASGQRQCADGPRAHPAGQSRAQAAHGCSRAARSDRAMADARCGRPATAWHAGQKRRGCHRRHRPGQGLSAQVRHHRCAGRIRRSRVAGQRHGGGVAVGIRGDAAYWQHRWACGVLHSECDRASCRIAAHRAGCGGVG